MRKFLTPILLGFFALMLLLPSVAPAQTDEDIKQALTKSVELMDAGRYAEAIPYLELLVKADPDEPSIRLSFGVALLFKSKQIDDTNEAKKLSASALEQFQAAKRLGAKDPAVDTFIQLLSGNAGATGADGAKLTDAQKYFQQAETLFAQSKYDEALPLYQKALAADPKMYEAALYAGDVYTQKQDWDNAERMYQRAISIDPLRETAYRYSATPLMKQKKYDQARDRYIEAYITEPYSDMVTRGIGQWAAVTGVKLGHPKVDFPSGNRSSAPGENNSSPPQDPWSAYLATRDEWRKTRFTQAFPAEHTYRHSLKEEAEAIRAAVKLNKAAAKSQDPQLDTLQKIDSDGLLEAYILLAVPDSGIARDYPGYLKDNRPQLRQYVLNYVIRK